MATQISTIKPQQLHLWSNPCSLTSRTRTCGQEQVSPTQINQRSNVK
jgi:hypothetical protein